MSISLRERGVRGIVLDIEGTTTPVSFVYDVLFPYAREHLRDGLRTLDPQQERMLRAEHAADKASGAEPPDLIDVPRDAARESIAEYIEWLMDLDRKSPALKELQGTIWERGYESGAIEGVVFADVPAAFEHWTAEGMQLALYSSGSALAQRLLFAHTSHGELTRFISHFFDTSFGAKRDSSSYARIARALELTPAEIVFVSDVPAELDAAKTAGMQVLLAIRPGNASVDATGYETVETFDDVRVGGEA